MKEITVRRSGGFTVLPNETLRDNRLSLKTRAVLAIMVSLPEDWDYSISGLAKLCGVGRDAIRSSLDELESCGYLVRQQCHDGLGKFARNLYIIYDVAQTPLSGNPSSGKPSSGEPLTGNPTQQNKDKQKKDLTNTPKPPQGADEGFDRFWKAYPLHKSRDRALRAWRRLKPSPELVETILSAVEVAKQSRGWTKDGGQFIPHAATWLNGKRWEDEYDGSPPASEPLSVQGEGVRYL